MPSVPCGGPHAGFFAVPAVGAQVWVVFEGGDPARPVWTGVFWSPEDVPVRPALPSTTAIVGRQARITLDDLPGVASIRLDLTALLETYVHVDQTGIELRCGPSTVRVDHAGVLLACGTSTLAMTPAGTLLTTGTSTLSVLAAGVTVDHQPVAVQS